MDTVQKTIKSFCIFVIRCYQCVVSPWFGKPCCYFPSCSEYAKEAIKIHGIGYGLYLAVKRLLRCHPLCRGGIDPVHKKYKL